MKKILIIGIDSFTGQHLKLYLEKYNYVVYGTSHHHSSKNIYQCDIAHKETVKVILEELKPNYIINLAAISFVATQNKELFYNINILAVENILESILEIEDYNPQKIVLVSSATIYGNQRSNLLTEDMNPNPVNHYGISKLGMEKIGKNYFNKLNIIITRPFNYTGSNQANHFLIPKIVSHYKEQKGKIELGNIDVYREFNDIGFVCEVYKKIFESNIKSEIINIASNRLIALKTVIENMNQIAGYRIDVKINSEFIRKNEIRQLSGCPKKLTSLIGECTQKDFIETLKEMYHD